jgi:phospholipid/cholesterol/gamma-HCH transport system ATP-binding protein
MSTGGRTDGSDAAADAAVVVSGLTVGYGGSPVLEDVDLSVRRREIVTVLGPSGCGKSTLLKAMTGLLPPWKGHIRVAGHDVGDADPGTLARLRHRIGVLFQSGALLGSRTVGENVALPLEEFSDLPADLIRRIVELKLDLVGLGDQEHLMPAELSGGMRKRAALARAMALDPEILFCDEPTAGLDPVTAVEIDRLLLELRDVLGVTVVVITHALGTIDNLSGTCVMLDAGKRGIIARGSPRELRASRDDRVRSFFERRVVRGPAGRGEKGDHE